MQDARRRLITKQAAIQNVSEQPPVRVTALKSFFIQSLKPALRTALPKLSGNILQTAAADCLF